MVKREEKCRESSTPRNLTQYLELVTSIVEFNAKIEAVERCLNHLGLLPLFTTTTFQSEKYTFPEWKLNVIMKEEISND